MPAHDTRRNGYASGRETSDLRGPHVKKLQRSGRRSSGRIRQTFVDLTSHDEWTDEALSRGCAVIFAIVSTAAIMEWR